MYARVHQMIMQQCNNNNQAQLASYILTYQFLTDIQMFD